VEEALSPASGGLVAGCALPDDDALEGAARPARPSPARPNRCPRRL
jgi:hypothetical protein